MAQKTHEEADASASGAFLPGRLAIVSLTNPREKFWGAVLGLSTAGLAVRGIDLLSFDDFASLVRSGTAVAASEVFFHMHRIERIEADQRNGEIPSLAERFLKSTGKTAEELFVVSRFSFSGSHAASTLARLLQTDHDLERGTSVNRAMPVKSPLAGRSRKDSRQARQGKPR